MARAEVSDYVTQVSSEQYTLDHTALCCNCPILKSTWLETIRLDAVGFEIKSILEDLTISETYEDAALLRGPEAIPRSYLLRAGNSISIPNSTAHTDPRFWENPGQFNASRFIVQDPRSEKGERAEWPRHFYAFGGGHTMCRGRLFAEKETLMFMAAFISFWDIEYLGHKDSAGNWLIKKGRQGGVALPAGERS